MKPLGNQLEKTNSNDTLQARRVNPVRTGNHPIIIRCEQKIIRRKTVMPPRNRKQIVSPRLAIVKLPVAAVRSAAAL